MEVTHPDQYGGMSKPSTLHALTSMVHNWSKAADGNGAAVRVVLFDYRKAFDFIDHTLLVRKVFGLSIPRCVASWVADFLIDRNNVSSYLRTVSRNGDQSLMASRMAKN